MERFGCSVSAAWADMKAGSSKSVDWAIETDIGEPRVA
jgi:hypothetical protein